MSITTVIVPKAQADRFNSHKWLFDVVGFYTADIMRGGAVQSVHQKLERLTELLEQRKQCILHFVRPTHQGLF